MHENLHVMFLCVKYVASSYVSLHRETDKSMVNETWYEKSGLFTQLVILAIPYSAKV